jgi:hypothetical protein
VSTGVVRLRNLPRGLKSCGFPDQRCSARPLVMSIPPAVQFRQRLVSEPRVTRVHPSACTRPFGQIDLAANTPDLRTGVPSCHLSLSCRRCFYSGPIPPTRPSTLAKHRSDRRRYKCTTVRCLVQRRRRAEARKNAPPLRLKPRGFRGLKLRYC